MLPSAHIGQPRHLAHFELLVGGADEGRRDRHISSSGQSNDDLWQNWLRERRPPTLIVWGRYDAVFGVAEVTVLRKDVPNAEVHLLDAGHFALDESASDVTRLMRGFLGRLSHRTPKATSTHG